MKKLFSVLAVLFVLGTTSAFSLGIGAQGGYTAGGAGNGALTFKLDKAPCVFAVNLDSLNPLVVGGTADWWLGNPGIQGDWRWYYGVGVGAGIRAGEGYADIGISGRALVGTNYKLLDNFLEFYLQAAWQPTLWFLGRTQDNSNIRFQAFCIPVNLGFRFWF